jgi:transcriptional regulator with XRE-family HTH domain
MAVDESALYELVGSSIRAARGRHSPKMSQIALAKKVRMTRASIVNIEAGRQRPPLHLLWNIAEALGVEPAQLLPRRVDLDEVTQPVRLDKAAVAMIEDAANGDPHTKRLLTRFVSNARTQASTKGGQHD